MRRRTIIRVSELETTTSSDSSDSDDLKIKGNKGVTEFSVADIRDKLSRIIPYYDIKTESLPENTRRDLDGVVRTLKKTHGTPSYRIMYDEIKKHYKPERHIKPGTVGWLLNGALVTSVVIDGNFDKRCIPMYAGIGPNGLGANPECKYQVLFAENNEQKGVYDFLDFSSDTYSGSSHGYIFVIEEGNFQGFNEEELIALRQKNIQHCMVITSSSDCRNYKPVYSDFRSLDEYHSNRMALFNASSNGNVTYANGFNGAPIQVGNQSPLVISPSGNLLPENQGSTGWMWIFFIIFIILLIILFVCLARRR